MCWFKFAVKDGLDDTFLPVRGDDRATGWDVRAAETVTLRPTELVKIPLGIRCLSPQGWWLELRPRSSTFAKKQLHALYGVIDESYEGEIIFACQWIPPMFPIPDNHHLVFNDPKIVDQEIRYIKTDAEIVSYFFDREFVIEKGDRIGQLVPKQRQEMFVESVSNEEFDKLCEQRGLARGAGGFGSTG